MKMIRSFFSLWFLSSIILVLLALCLYYSKATLEGKLISQEWLIASEFLKCIGIALFVASIFTLTIETEQFTNYIRDKLQQIVISKNFIKTLNPEQKKEILNTILKPSNKQVQLYSNINEYFQQYIDQSLTLFNTIFKTGVVFNIVAYVDREKDLVVCEQELSYRVYKASDKFESLKMGFEHTESKLLMTRITAPDGKSKDLDKGQSTTDIIKRETLKKCYFQEIPDDFNSYDHLTVYRKMKEYGNNHWQIYSYTNLSPCDGVLINLHCKDNLVIKEYNCYGHNKDFKADLSDDKTAIRVAYNEWLSPGFGIYILISRQDDEDVIKQEAVA